MKNIILIILFLPLVGLAQISFFRTYSNDGFDRGEGVAQLKDSSYLITGSSSSFLSNSKQAFIMQVDSVGNFMWSKDYGGAESDKGRRIFHVENDGIYVLGQTNSFGTSFYDAYFFKTDLQGNLLFENRYGGDSYEDVFDAVMLKDTSFIAVGETSSTPNEVEDVYIFRVNKLGERLWTKSLGTIYSDKAKSIKIYDDTTVYIVGEMYDETQLKQRGMLMKMHINGTVEWTKLYGSESKHGFNDLNITNDTIRIVGYVYNETQNDRSNLYMSSHLLDGTLIKQNIEYNTGTYSIDFIEKYNDMFLLLKSIKDEPSIPTYQDGLDASAYLYDGDLNYQVINSLVVSFKFSNIGDDIINQMIKTNDSGMVVIGYSSSPTIGGNNVLFCKVGKGNTYTPSNVTSDLVSLFENKSFNFSIFPNPFSTILKLDSDQEILNIKIFDSTNKLVLISKEKELDLNYLTQGIYFAEIEIKNKTFKTKLVKTN